MNQPDAGGGVYERRYVALLDILGFAGALSASESDADLARKLTLAVIGNDLEAFETQPELKKFRVHELGWQCYAFSDTIILTGEDTPRGLRHVLHGAHRMYGKIACEAGLLLRGAITRGFVYEDNYRVVTGPAVAEAHEHEQHAAVYPRIILKPGLVSPQDYQRYEGGDPKTVKLVTDADGYTIIDPVESRTSWQVLGCQTMFPSQEYWREQLSQIARDGMAKFMASPGTWAKYSWLACRVEASKDASNSPALGP